MCADEQSEEEIKPILEGIKKCIGKLSKAEWLTEKRQKRLGSPLWKVLSASQSSYLGKRLAEC